jgi:hypothetical protein
MRLHFGIAGIHFIRIVPSQIPLMVNGSGVAIATAIPSRICNCSLETPGSTTAAKARRQILHLVLPALHCTAPSPPSARGRSLGVELGLPLAHSSLSPGERAVLYQPLPVYYLREPTE